MVFRALTLTTCVRVAFYIPMEGYIVQYCIAHGGVVLCIYFVHGELARASAL